MNANTTDTVKLNTDVARVAHVVDWFARHCDIDDGDRGTRARLRRTRANHEALAIPATIELARRLGAARDGDQQSNGYLEAVIGLARVLSHVKHHVPNQHLMSLAGWKKFPADGATLDADDYPKLSEVRFKRLIQQDLDGDARISAFIRLIDLLGGEVDVESVWRDYKAYLSPVQMNALKKRWALQYYLPRSNTSENQDNSLSNQESDL